MGCVTMASFVVPVNGFGSDFFKSSNGMGCPLSAYSFLLVAEGLSRAILEARWRNKIKGSRVGREQLTHILFIDDVLL